jgi:hypothetical protein
MGKKLHFVAQSCVDPCAINMAQTRLNAPYVIVIIENSCEFHFPMARIYAGATLVCRRTACSNNGGAALRGPKA